MTVLEKYSPQNKAFVHIYFYKPNGRGYENCRRMVKKSKLESS